jgi:hypothetical protein
MQEESAERDSAKEAGDDREQLNTSDDQLEDGLLLIWSLGIEMTSQALLPCNGEKYRMRQTTKLNSQY